jgi:putative salt-induced outer membrane protein
MRLRSVFVLMTLLALLAPAVTFAQATAPPPTPPRQEGTAELAFVGTTGNTSTSTFSAGAEHIFRPTGWLIKNRAQKIRGKSAGIVTAETLLYGFRGEKSINARVSAFGDYGYYQDEPAGIRHRHGVTGGLAFKIIDRARQTLGADVGAGYLNEKRIAGADLASATWAGGTSYKLKLSDTSEITDDIRLLGLFDDADDWRATHALALTARLTSVLSLKVSNIVRYANVPPPGFKRTDTTTAVALVASFKKQ